MGAHRTRRRVSRPGVLAALVKTYSLALPLWASVSLSIKTRGIELEFFWRFQSALIRGLPGCLWRYFFFFFLIMYFFLAVLGLRGCVQAVCSGREWGLLFTALLGLLIAVACPASEHRLWASGAAAHACSCTAGVGG